MVLYIIILFIIIYLLNSNNENFDQRVDGSSKEQCGIMCSKILGCNSFAYDENNKYCYLSKKEIIFNNQQSNYSQFYNKKFPRCNKLYMISDPLYNARNNIIQNATYKCMDYENDVNKDYKIYDNKERKNIDIKKLNSYEIYPYKFVEIDWNYFPYTENKNKLNKLQEGQMKSPINLNENLWLIKE